MPSTLPLTDRAAYADARELIAAFGGYAAAEAAQRARACRETGNVLQYCRWRQAERAVAMVRGPQPAGTIH